MRGTPIQNRKLNKIIISLKKEFPSPVQYISISRISDVTRIFFISPDNIDHTYLFMEKAYNGDTMYNYILKQIDDEFVVAKRLNTAIDFYIKIPQRNFLGILDNNFFWSLRHRSGLSLKEIQLELNISEPAIYHAESVYKDISASTLLRYAILFKEPIFNFFCKEYKAALIEDVVAYLLKKELITKEIYTNIINTEKATTV